MLRSEEVALYSLVLPRSGAYNIFLTLGKMNCVHFVNDSNPQSKPVHMHQFYEKYKQIEKQILLINEFYQEIEKNGLKIERCQDIEKWQDEMDKSIKIKLSQTNTPQEQYFNDTIYKELTTYQEKLQQYKLNYEQLIQQRNEFVQQYFFTLQYMEYFEKQIDEEKIGESGIDITIGSVLTEYEESFQRTIFRAFKGNCWINIKPIQFESQKYKIYDPKTGQVINRSCFLVARYTNKQKEIESQSEYQPGKFVQEKFDKICSSFDAIIMNKQKYPKNKEELKNMIQKSEEDIKEGEQVIISSEQEIINILQSMTKKQGDVGSECSQIEGFYLYCLREKYIYQNMLCLSLRDSASDYTIVLAWIEKKMSLQVMENLNKLNVTNNIAPCQLSLVEDTQKNPPTLLKTNAFTQTFQDIVDTYGVPNHKEVNPALFTIITFPFLFGVMYGDVGHGSCLFLFSLYLCAQTKGFNNSKDMNTLISNRYILVLMGFFAIFCGLLYNEFFAFPLNLLGSCYPDAPDRKPNCVYQFGIDPVWNLADNKLQFFNSFKMKLAIILGVTQMSFGLCLKAVNNIHQKMWLEFWFEFIPQIIFLMSTFGYMVIMILIKWNTDYTGRTHEAPSILTTFLNFVLKGGSTDGMNLYGEDGSQEVIQGFLLFFAIVSVPVMLCVKPAVMYYQQKKHEEQQVQHHVDDENVAPILPQPQAAEVQSQAEKDHDFSEIVVHQIIETIEFVLGSISHTASYLRLWALSLAHSQLAEVFFALTAEGSVNSGNPFWIATAFLPFMLITFGVLLCMDVMECCLHTLRLHWVEFQSKFFKGDGYRFEKFSFVTFLEDLKYSQLD